MPKIAFGFVGLVLLLLTLFLFPPIATAGDLGLCLPSPNLWHLRRFWAWLINAAIIFLSAAVISSANKKYNFIPEAVGVAPYALILLLACNCICTGNLTASVLLLICNAVSLFIIISTYEQRNSTREFFIIGTFLAFGAMVQYAFLVMIPVYIGSGLLMKSFRLREFIAFIFGLLAPYWILMGLGVISPMDFQLPDSLTVIRRSAVEENIFLTLVATGIMALMGFIISLYNTVRLFSRNSRLRCIHMSFNLMGYVAVLAVIFDFNNFVAYFATIALWLAVEMAAMLYLYNIRRHQFALLLLLLIFLPLYILAL